jgi:deoxyribodipyrimidine photo-lyase
LLWLRRDLRRRDLPAHCRRRAPDGVAVAFVVDPEFFDTAGAAPRAWLARTLRALSETYDGGCVRPAIRSPSSRPWRPRPAPRPCTSPPRPNLAARRDERVRAALATRGVAWVETGSPYAVTPGRLTTGAGTGFQVFTPFSRAWRDHGWREPAQEPAGLRLLAPPADEAAWALLDRAGSADNLPTLPQAGEAAALSRWRQFLDHELDGYRAARDRPDLDGTSRLSPYLKFGVHPDPARRPAGRAGRARRVTELAWREFYADVVHHNPDSLARPEPAGVDYATGEAFDAWREGRTGCDRRCGHAATPRDRLDTTGSDDHSQFPHQDLRQWWPVGAEWFARHLIDIDLASNTHGWQWTAGTGTDAAPYFRVFNPVLQGKKFDPQGEYVRRWVPELAHLPGPLAHEPWRTPRGTSGGYPDRIVDHAEERAVALARYHGARQVTGSR